MIRLTLLLLAGIGASMAIFGGTSDLPQGSDGGDYVARADTASSGLLTGVGALLDFGAAEASGAAKLPLADEERAIQIAVAATVAPTAPAAPRPQIVKLSTSEQMPAVSSADTPAPGAALWFVTGSRVNLRAGPSTSDLVVGQVQLGQSAEVLESTADGWYRIRTADDGKTGFIYGKFLSEQRPT